MTNSIPLAKPHIGDAEIAAVLRVLQSGRLAQGPEVAAFEIEFSALVEGRHCVAVNSGTSALHLSMLALGIGPGDEVIVPSFSFAASANAIALTGAAPVFVDIEPGSYCIDPAAVASAVTARTKAIMPVHMYGHPADMPALSEIAVQHSLALVEDAAQAHGASIGTKMVGTFGQVGCFSFYPTKNMTSGEGGMVVTLDESLARRVRLLRNQGMETRYANEIVGFNNRMTDLHAAIGRVQLRQLPAWNDARRQNADVLNRGLPASVVIPTSSPGVRHVYHQYTVRSHARDVLRDRVRGRGVECDVYYPVPIHRLPAYGLMLDLPETERATREVLSLPVHPALSSADLRLIVEAVGGA